MMAPDTDKPRHSLLRDVYKDMLKSNYRVLKRYKTHVTTQVVLALDKGDNSQVILKLPNPTLDRGTISFRSDEIRREYQIVSEIDSPHVMKVVDFYSGGEGENRFFIALFEYIPGPTLREIIDKGPLTLAQIKEIFQSLAMGLADVYKAGYNHADLKPENVIFNPERGPVLIDFQHALQTSRSGPILEEWCDLLYEAITGRQGHFGPEDTVRKLLEKRGVLQPSEIAAAEALQKIIGRALGKPGTTPYTDFDSFLKDLDQWEVPR